MGSSVDGTFTAASDLCMMALIAACLKKRPWLLIQLFCKSGCNTSGCSVHHITVKTCIGIVGAIHSKVAIYLPTYPTTMNLLGECNSINSMYMPWSESLFVCADFDNRYR